MDRKVKRHQLSLNLKPQNSTTSTNQVPELSYPNSNRRDTVDFSKPSHTKNAPVCQKKSVSALKHTATKDTPNSIATTPLNNDVHISSDTCMSVIEEQQPDSPEGCALNTGTTEQTDIQHPVSVKQECQGKPGIPTSVKQLLPSEYDYLIECYTEHKPENFLGAEITNFTMCVWANVHCESEAVKWINDFEEVSKTTYRVSTGSQITGQRLLFKTVRHCHHYRKKRILSQLSKENKVKTKNFQKRSLQEIRKPCVLVLWYFEYIHLEFLEYQATMSIVVLLI